MIYLLLKSQLVILRSLRVLLMHLRFSPTNVVPESILMADECNNMANTIEYKLKLEGRL